MKLPSSLLRQLRVGIATGAVLASGCDVLQGEVDGEPETPAAAQAATPAPTTAPRAAAAPTWPEPAASTESQPEPGLSRAVARAVDETRASAAVNTIDEDPTAFVPFNTDPGPRVRERTESPLAFGPPPKAKPRTKRPHKVIKKGGAPAWDGCPACGRG